MSGYDFGRDMTLIPLSNEASEALFGATPPFQSSQANCSQLYHIFWLGERRNVVVVPGLAVDLVQVQAAQR